MAASSHRIPIRAFVSDEDQARARWYAFLSHLFREPPDAGLLASFTADPAAGAGRTDDTAPLQRAWTEFAGAASEARADAVREEFERTFVSTGKAPVPPHGCYFMTGFLNERPLVELREQLALLGLVRRQEASETEDHIASLCEVMAHLIAGDSDGDRLAAQRDFFGRFIAPWYERFAEALETSEQTDFYRAVARLMRCFFEVERLAFAFET